LELMSVRPEKLAAWALAAAFGLSLLLGVVLRDQIACGMVEAAGLSALAPNVFAEDPEGGEAAGLVESARQRVGAANAATGADPVLIFSDSSFWSDDEAIRTIVTPFRTCIVIGRTERNVDEVSQAMARAELTRRGATIATPGQSPARFAEGAAGQTDAAQPGDVADLRMHEQSLNAPSGALAERQAAAQQHVAQFPAQHGDEESVSAMMATPLSETRVLQSTPADRAPRQQSSEFAASSPLLAGTFEAQVHTTPFKSGQPESTEDANVAAMGALAQALPLPPIAVPAAPPTVARQPENPPMPAASEPAATGAQVGQVAEPRQIPQKPDALAGGAPPPEVQKPEPRYAPQAEQSAAAVSDFPTGVVPARNTSAQEHRFGSRYRSVASLAIAPRPLYVGPAATRPAIVMQGRGQPAAAAQIEIWRPQRLTNGQKPLILTGGPGPAEPLLSDKRARSEALYMKCDWRRVDTSSGLLYLARQQENAQPCSTDSTNGYCLCRRANMRRGR
jgi:hypothetical protein